MTLLFGYGIVDRGNKPWIDGDTFVSSIHGGMATDLEMLNEDESDPLRPYRIVALRFSECVTCDQIDSGQTGEYSCPECGLPTVHDSV